MDNSIDRYGSSNFCTEDEIVAAGYFRRTKDSVLIGFFGLRPLWYSGLGAQTLSYDDEKEQGRARHAANSALNRLFEGDDSLSPMIDYVHHSREAKMQTKQMRLLRTPPEILSMPSDQQIIHADGLPHPIEADRKHYTEQRFMAGRFHPNRYYPPLDRVRVKTRFGHAWRRVIEEPVPPEFAHLSQYAEAPGPASKRGSGGRYGRYDRSCSHAPVARARASRSASRQFALRAGRLCASHLRGAQQ